MTRPPPEPVPVTVLTGFLGVGKTTLLNRILNGDHGLRVAVVVNDFGSVNIDAELVVGVESEVVSLANGCICCTIRDDLIATAQAVLNRPERPELILLEASGVADPLGIAQTFNGTGTPGLRLESILCVIDAEQLFAVPEQMELKLFQMACADMVVLNKVDLVTRDAVKRIRTWLDGRFHRYRLVEARRGDVPLPVLLSLGRYDPMACQAAPANRSRASDAAVLDHLHHDTDHEATFETWTYENDVPLSLDALRATASRLPDGVYRAKGVVRTVEAPDRRTVLQVAGRRVEIELDGQWGDRVPGTTIVVIGATGATSTSTLKSLFDACARAG